MKRPRQQLSINMAYLGKMLYTRFTSIPKIDMGLPKTGNIFHYATLDK